MNDDDFAGVLLFYVAGNGDVAVIGDQLGIFDKLGEVLDVFAFGIGVENPIPVRFGEFVLVALPDEFRRSVDEKNGVVLFALLEDNNAGGDGRSEKKVRGQLNYRVNVVVFQKIFPDLHLRTAPVKDAGKFDDGRRSAGGKP